MTETSVPGTTLPDSATALPMHETLGQKVGDWFHHAEQDAAGIDADLKTALTDHASQVLDVAGDALAFVKLVAPQDAAAAEAVDTFIGKVLAMAQSAAKIAGTALASGSKSS